MSNGVTSTFCVPDDEWVGRLRAIKAELSAFSHDLIYSLHRAPENYYSQQQCDHDFALTSRRLAQTAKSLNITLHLRVGEAAGRLVPAAKPKAAKANAKASKAAKPKVTKAAKPSKAAESSEGASHSLASAWVSTRADTHR